jgi:aryl-alcohol dehydrogenase-like predicted oxidoreductase
VLASAAGDLLDAFTVSTKVGFFPGANGLPVHSLQPESLRAAIEQAGNDLGKTPDVVFLHNPERTLASRSAGEGRELFASACAELGAAVKAGLCGSWGVASWDPRPLVDVIGKDALRDRPSALLVRAGLSVPDCVLTAAETAREAFGLARGQCWGMSPFGGDTTDEAWRVTNLSPFLAPHERCTTAQAAFRLAYELPSVARVAVGTSDPVHLTELVAATDVAVAGEAIGRYRELIRGADRT